MTAIRVQSSLVSIVIPCFNAERYVADAVRSGLEQTYPRVEVIVVDDGSTDRSREVLRSFGQAIRWEEGLHQGGCAARNRGLQLASGELIQFLDADDWLFPTKLQKQVAVLFDSPETSPVCDGVVIQDGQVVQRYLAPENSNDSLVTLLTSQLPTPAPLHRRERLLQIGGFRGGLPCSQERDLHLRLACHGWKLQRVAEPLYGVRRLPDSVSHSLERVLVQHLPIARHLYKLLETNGGWNEERACALAAFLARDARHLCRMGRIDLAHAYFEAAREFHPSGGLGSAYSGSASLLARAIGPSTFERVLSLWPRGTVSS